MVQMRKAGRSRAVFRRRRKPWLPLLLVLVILGGAGFGGYYAFVRNEPTADQALVRPQEPCEIDRAILQRVARGFYPRRSGDVLAIEQEPNSFGTRHSTPFPYTQEIPIVLYGPGYIRQGVTVDRDVTMADIAPTYAELLGFDDFPKREGNVLEEALLPEAERNGVPKLIFTLVWDGGGDNVLEQWPRAWPELQNLMNEGTSFENATVGSSPSITPSIHATLGTGAFPKTHGVTDIKIRIGGQMHEAMEGASPETLKIPTIADIWDRANSNEPLIGMLARDAWHLTMMGHGSFPLGADSDIAVLDDLGGVEFRQDLQYYSTPDYLAGTEGLEEAVNEVDQRDGEQDAMWLGNSILPYDPYVRYTPAWPLYQTPKIVEVLRNEGFGADDMPDLFYTNYKSTDLAGHEWNMLEPEVRDDLKAQDAEIPKLISALDLLVGENNYVLALTADHGMTPDPAKVGGWSINQRELTNDIERRFDKASPFVPLILSNRSYQVMLRASELRKNDITPADIAHFIADYRLEDNATAATP